MWSASFLALNAMKKSGGEDPERSGGISLLLLRRKPKEKDVGEDPELSGVISLLFLMGNPKRKGGRRIRSFRE